MNADLSRALLMLCCWRGSQVEQAQAFLLMGALQEGTITAACIPGEILNGSKHISGAAVRVLLECELLEAIGYVPSPNKNAHGRIVRQLAIPAGKRSTVQTWLKNRGYQDATPTQQEMKLTA